MYLIYVDESGDVGMNNSPSTHFALSGIVVHELRWSDYLNQLIQFRRRVRRMTSLKLREEIHSARFITRPEDLSRIPKHERLAILRMFADELNSMTDLNIINVVVDKTGKPSTYDVFENAWRGLLQRFENTIRHHNFPGPQNPDDRGMIIPDNTNNKKLITLLRRMRRYNPIPNQSRYGIGYRDLHLQYIIEDPTFRDSRDSYFIQAADLAAFLLYQYENPNSYIRKKHAHKYFERLDAILCKVASAADPFGIVHL